MTVKEEELRLWREVVVAYVTSATDSHRRNPVQVSNDATMCAGLVLDKWKEEFKLSNDESGMELL